jgi:uncharacterized RDD family membrane protein YckC
MTESGAVDPRTIITPDAFQVAPELLGLSLARPWRRALAILIDLALVALLANARSVFFAIALGVFVFWLTIRPRKQSQRPSAVRRLARGTFGCMGGMTLTGIALAVWFTLSVDPETTLFETQGVPVSLSDLGDIATVAAGDDTAAVAPAAERIVERLIAEGASAEDIRSALDGISGLSPSARARIDQMLILQESDAEEQALDSADVDALLAGYTQARSGGDSAGMADYGSALGTELAAEQLQARDGRIAGLEASNTDLSSQLSQSRADLESEQNSGIVQRFIGALDELGLGLGWSGLYFTFFLGFWRGRTPGKRLLRIRVVRLDGRPLGYWVSFERFGGYAASLFTGLEGFARILWDRNRQALEDKLAETVVIRDTPDARNRVSELHRKAADERASARR